MIKNGDIDDHQTYAQRLDADDDGRFELASRDESFELVITHDEGFAHVKSLEGPVPPKIALTPWAAVEGVFRVGPEPAPRALLELSVGAIGAWGPDAPNISTWYTTTTDKDGRYEFARVFPGVGSVSRSVPFYHGKGATVIASSSRIPATFVAGQTSQLDIGGSGRAVAGRLLAPTGFVGRFPWQFALLTLEADRERPMPPEHPKGIRQTMKELDAALRLEADLSGPEPPSLLEMGDNVQALAAKLRAWQSTPEGQAYVAEEKAYVEALKDWQEAQRVAPYLTASVELDGSFRIDDTPPGNYALTLSFVGYDEPSPAKIDQKVTIPGGEINDPALDLGKLQLQPVESP